MRHSYYQAVDAAEGWGWEMTQDERIKAYRRKLRQLQADLEIVADAEELESEKHHRNAVAFQSMAQSIVDVLK